MKLLNFIFINRFFIIIQLYMAIGVFNIVGYSGLVLWLVVMLVHLIAFLRAKFYLFSTVEGKQGQIEHGVSIIKTIVNYSPEVIVNLESTFCLDYPKFEIKICIQDKENPVLPYVQDVVMKYPHVDCQIFEGAVDIGINPKVNNLMQCYNSLKYDYVWICDSNIKVTKDSLTELATHLSDDVGMVHQLPFIDSSCKGYGGALEKVYFGTHHARWYLFINSLNIPCCNGMSSIFNKTILEKLGGLESLANNIAEDHYMALKFHENGYKLVLSTEPAYQNPSKTSYPYFIERMTRWQILRLTMLPSGLLEPFIENILLGLIFSSCTCQLYNMYFLNAFLFHLVVWFLSDALLLMTIEKKFHSPIIELVCGWLFRELTTYYIFISALLNRKVNWNTGSYKMNFNISSVSKFLPNMGSKNT